MNKYIFACTSFFILSSFSLADSTPNDVASLLKHSETREQGMQIVESQGKSSIPVLRAIMHDEALDGDTRIAAHLAMAKTKSPDATPILQNCLAHDQDPFEREASAIALGQLGDTNAIPQLKKSLQDMHGNVRMRAVWALAKLGDKSGKEVAMDAFKKSDITEKFLSIEALEAIGDQDVIPRLKVHYSDKQPFNSTIAKLAVHHLEVNSVGTESKISYLQHALLEPEHEIELWAADELGKLFDQGSVEALEILKETAKDEKSVGQYAARKQISILISEGKLTQNQLQ